MDNSAGERKVPSRLPVALCRSAESLKERRVRIGLTNHNLNSSSTLITPRLTSHHHITRNRRRYASLSLFPSSAIVLSAEVRGNRLTSTTIPTNA